jgi:CHASE3 domain sensor protein
MRTNRARERARSRIVWEHHMLTFGKKLFATFALSFALLLAIGAVSHRSLSSLTETSQWVTHTHEVLNDLATILSLLKDAETGQRGYVVTGNDAFLEPYHAAIAGIPKTLRELREKTRDNTAQQQRLDKSEPLIAAKLAQVKRVIETRKADGFEPARTVVQSAVGKNLMDDVRGALGEMEKEERRLLELRARDAEGAANTGRSTILYGTLLSLLLLSALGLSLNRSLETQIGTATDNMLSSSAELQAAANQQVVGTKQQSTAMSEITTTIRELLVTSRQIADASQRVTQVATDTVSAAVAGRQRMEITEESVRAIRQQVDRIVLHMVELGKKSQQIGGITALISELAEQTNILAINATIEAAGAGDAGKRFAVVADEVRKLSDRVGGSIKEIHGLVDDIRGAVNATVMATESGSKTVEAGARQFGDVASAFNQIADLVATTTDAAREIELSTKQQAVAVEQVNLAIANVAQAAKETEASSTQTFQTASELTKLSSRLARIIRPEAAARA